MYSDFNQNMVSGPLDIPNRLRFQTSNKAYYSNLVTRKPS